MKNLMLISFYLVIISCKKEEQPVSEVKGLDYYPYETGKFVVYDVDSTVYTELPRDTFYYKYRIKEKIADEFTDNQGKRSFRLERYIKHYNSHLAYDSMAWAIKEVWMLNPDQSKILIQENNNVFTRLIFPVLQNATWNGNAYNLLGTDNYTYEYADRQETLSGIKFEKVLKVKQSTDTLNKIQYMLNYEKYAAGIGLIFKKRESLYSNKVVANIPVYNRIEYGFAYNQTLISYGNE